jgi:hypothetical protein
VFYYGLYEVYKDYIFNNVKSNPFIQVSVWKLDTYVVLPPTHIDMTWKLGAIGWKRLHRVYMTSAATVLILG